MAHLPRALPSLEYLRENFSYDAETGVLCRIKKNAPHSTIGPVTRKDRKGYLILCTNMLTHKAHRIAYKMHYGVDPDGYLDHINGERDDNRIENLRVASNTVNNCNQIRHRKGNTPYLKQDKQNKWIFSAPDRYNIRRSSFDTISLDAANYCIKNKFYHTFNTILPLVKKGFSHGK